MNMWNGRYETTSQGFCQTLTLVLRISFNGFRILSQWFYKIKRLYSDNNFNGSLFADSFDLGFINYDNKIFIVQCTCTQLAIVLRNTILSNDLNSEASVSYASREKNENCANSSQNENNLSTITLL